MSLLRWTGKLLDRSARSVLTASKPKQELRFEIEPLEPRMMLSAVVQSPTAFEQAEQDFGFTSAEFATAEVPNEESEELVQVSQVFNRSMTGVTETDGVASIDVTDGNEINAAFTAVSQYLAATPSATSGVVNVTATTSFSNTLITQDNIVLRIDSGVTLTLDTLQTGNERAIDTSGTINSGVIGTGTVNINGNALFAIYSDGSDGLNVGNVGDSNSDPTKLKITGWRFGVYVVSNAQTAARNITIENLEVSQPHTSFVEIPVFISVRPSVNGRWVENVTINNLLVDGSQAGGVVGSHSGENGFTADQVILQGVHGGTVTNVVSRNGGENGLDVNSGSRDVVVSNVTIENPDAHAFNLGGSGQALDVANESGFQVGQIIRGATSGTVAEVIGVFAGRIWTLNATVNRFEVGETLEVTDSGSNVATTINAVFRTENITLENSFTTGAGRNTDQIISDATGQLVVFSDVFIQQADNIQINNNTFASIGRDDASGGFAEHFGINANVGSFSISGNTFVDYVNQTPVVRNANSSQTIGDPDTNTIYGTAGDDDFIGTDFTDTIDSGSGNDTLSGGGGNDHIAGTRRR